MSLLTPILPLLLLLPHPSHHLPAGCVFRQTDPHSYAFWGCTRPTGGACGLKKHIVCDSADERSLQKKSSPTPMPTMPTTTFATPTVVPIQNLLEAIMKQKPVREVIGNLARTQPGYLARLPAVTRTRRFSPSPEFSLLCLKRRWLPICKEFLTKRAVEIVGNSQTTVNMMSLLIARNTLN